MDDEWLLWASLALFGLLALLGIFLAWFGYRGWH